MQMKLRLRLPKHSRLAVEKDDVTQVMLPLTQRPIRWSQQPQLLKNVKGTPNVADNWDLPNGVGKGPLAQMLL